MAAMFGLEVRRAATVAIAVVVAVVLGASCGRGGSTYAALRQAKTEPVPGTFGFELAPPPSSFEPSVTPAQAYAAAVPAGQTPPGPWFRTLASVSSRYSPGPAWVFVFRDLCFASNKGDVVSPARAAAADAGCSTKNLYVEVVDAATGHVVSSETGYDVSAAWAPATASA